MNEKMFICPKCKVGKESIELDNKSIFCPYIDLHNGDTCKKFSPIENINNIGSQKRTKEYINVDGKYITGKCPSAAIDLGIKVIEILYGKELANKAYYGLYGLEK